MDSWIDGLTRKLAASTSRRATLKILAGCVGALAASALSSDQTAAQTPSPNEDPCRNVPRTIRGNYKACGRDCIPKSLCCPSTDCLGGTCLGANCHCPPATTRCAQDDGTKACVDLRTSNANCGRCGLSCPGTSTCGGSGTPGVCGCTPDCTGKTCGTNGCGGSCGTCTSPSICCDGTCVNASTDATHCGNCTTNCASSPNGKVCLSGACGCQGEGDCGTGQTCCSQKCTNLQTDRNNCNACGNVCPPFLTCSGGSCVCNPTSCPSSNCICLTTPSGPRCIKFGLSLDCSKGCTDNAQCSSGEICVIDNSCGPTSGHCAQATNCTG
jgi:hypothetical protein